MGDDTMKSEYPNEKQRAAVCHSQYSRRKKKAKGSVKWDDCRKGDIIVLL
jgi:hypothetical protein